jgi:hypothetical protein
MKVLLELVRIVIIFAILGALLNAAFFYVYSKVGLNSEP